MPLYPAEIMPISEFVAARPRIHARILAIKAQRRVHLGEAIVLCFENRDTLCWQVQEMCRVEQLKEISAIQHELDTYGELLPSTNELSATLLIGFEDPAERDRQLRALVGLHQHLYLQIGDQRIPARFDKEQFSDARISSVQFVRFPLDAAAYAAFLDFRCPVSFGIDHPAYQANTILNPGARGALVEDLQAA